MTARAILLAGLAPLLLAAAPTPPPPPVAPSLLKPVPQMSIQTTVRPDPLAPMPNRLIEGPTTPHTDGVSLSPSLYGRERFTTGRAYPYGSDAPTEQEMRKKLVPGLNLKVPLQ